MPGHKGGVLTSLLKLVLPRIKVARVSEREFTLLQMHSELTTKKDERSYGTEALVSHLIEKTPHRAVFEDVKMSMRPFSMRRWRRGQLSAGDLPEHAGQCCVSACSRRKSLYRRRSAHNSGE